MGTDDSIPYSDSSASSERYTFNPVHRATLKQSGMDERVRVEAQVLYEIVKL